jgi:hypothetical protein
MHPVFTVVATFIFQVQRLGAGKKCFANSCLSSASDNFDEELMMDHDLDKLPHFSRQVITSSLEFLKKSSTYNNLFAIVKRWWPLHGGEQKSNFEKLVQV